MAVRFVPDASIGAESASLQAVAPGHSAVYNRAVVNAKSVAIGSPMSDNPASSPFAIPTTIQE
jgi:hypothetical protein